MSGISDTYLASTYSIPTTDNTRLAVTWPIFTDEGSLAMVRIDFNDKNLCASASGFTDKAVSTIKTCLAPYVDSVMEVVYVEGRLYSCASVWVVDRDDDHPKFDLVWNFMAPEDLLQARGLPDTFLEMSFSPAELPDVLELTRRQHELIKARQRQGDTSALLYSLEAIQEVLSRNPGAIKVEVSEETAIALLAIHGASAARALHGFERYPNH